MQHRYFAATLLILTGVTACSSTPAALKVPRGALPGGTAQVTVNGSGIGPIEEVKCETLGKGLTEINIGSNGPRVTALVGANAQTLQAVSFDEIEGFTGSYWQGLQGNGRLGMVDQTYTLSGTAAGFSTEHPFARTTTDFTISVAC